MIAINEEYAKYEVNVLFRYTLLLPGQLPVLQDSSLMNMLLQDPPPLSVVIFVLW